ncbi:MAG: hypothetical protein FWG65_01505 [Turicibacter sp.]|nr:hypothetical protein [Turicibacter sp.]
MHDFIKNNPKYHYSRLNTEEKAVYSAILRALLKYQPEVKIPRIESETASKIYNAITQDNPLIYYAPWFKWTAFDATHYILKPDYIYEKSLVKSWNRDILGYLSDFDKLKAQDDYTKELAIHQHILANFSYDWDFGKNTYSILGLILYNTAVCEGIAKFAKLACDYVGLKSLVVTGKASNPASGQMEGHAWNIIAIDGKPYHADFTFDMCLTKSVHRYDYFNLTDADIETDHIIEGNAPQCTAVECNYFVANSLFLHNANEFRAFMRKQVRAGNNRVLFKLSQNCRVAGIEQKIMKIVGEEFQRIRNVAFRMEVSSNLPQMVFEVSVL